MTDNPLSKLYRTKSVFVSLPSKGNFYTSGINLSIDGELGVMPMTARDEIELKSPDSLFNGDGLINLIKSCVPDIKHPEEMPSCDIDPIILSIRAASNKMIDIDIVCPSCKNKETYEVDITKIISTAKQINLEDSIILLNKNTKINIRPYSLRSQLKANIQKFHHTRMDYLLNNSEVSDTDKAEMFSKAFVEATTLSIELITDNILSVELDGTVVTNRDHISEWVNNMDKDTYKLITEKIKSISGSNMNNNIITTCNKCNNEHEVSVELNPVNFFI
jgi:hypothetical protein